MSVNLANVYAELLRKYGENYTITYGSPPSYLSSIAGAGEVGNKIIFVFKEDRNGVVAAEPATTSQLAGLKRDRSSSNSALDLTGSPLKDDCIGDSIENLSMDLQLICRNPWKPEEEYQRGMTGDKARAIICSEQFQQNDGNGSVWFLCDGSDYGRTLLLQYEFSPTHFVRGILHYVGVMPAKAVTSEMVTRQHTSAASGSFETYIQNTYQVIPYMELCCSWSTHAQEPPLIDLSACEVTLMQTFYVSACGRLTRDLMNQLRILLYIREDIISYHKEKEAGKCRDPVYRCGRGIEMDELRESINKTMTAYSGFANIPSTGQADFDIEEIVQRANVRKLPDLTDQLWELLKCCSSFKDLTVGFNILFQCAARCNIVNTPMNKNRLAEIITQLANRRLAIPCLSGAEPLELLLEIGMEKLYKDYEFIFTESKMCSTNLLKTCGETTNHDGKSKDEESTGVSNLRKSLHNAAVRGEPVRKTLLHRNTMKQGGENYQSIPTDGFRNSNFDELSSLSKIAKLFQIHCTLEHLLMIHINLNLSMVYGDVCAQLLKKPSRMLESIDDNLSDAIEIPLSPHYVREYLDNKMPNSRHITMQTRNKCREFKTILHFNVDNVCPSSLADCFECDEKELTKERTYHSWLYRKISSLK